MLEGPSEPLSRFITGKLWTPALFRLAKSRSTVSRSVLMLVLVLVVAIGNG